MHEAAVIQSLREQVGPFVPEGAVLKEVRIDVGPLEPLDGTVMQATRAALTGEGGDGWLRWLRARMGARTTVKA